MAHFGAVPPSDVLRQVYCLLVFVVSTVGEETRFVFGLWVGFGGRRATLSRGASSVKCCMYERD